MACSLFVLDFEGGRYVGDGGGFVGLDVFFQVFADVE